jgi:hypothetical protein
MRKKKATTPESVVRQIKRNTRKKYGAEEKIRIVLEGLRGESSMKGRSCRSASRMRSTELRRTPLWPSSSVAHRPIS